MTRWRVYCAATRQDAISTRYGRTFCDWRGGTRKAKTREDAERKPCPRCGDPVRTLPNA